MFMYKRGLNILSWIFNRDKLSIRGYKLKVEDAPEPSTIIWYGVSAPVYFFMLCCCCCCCVGRIWVITGTVAYWGVAWLWLCLCWWSSSLSSPYSAPSTSRRPPQVTLPILGWLYAYEQCLFTRKQQLQQSALLGHLHYRDRPAEANFRTAQSRSAALLLWCYGYLPAGDSHFPSSFLLIGKLVLFIFTAIVEQ